MAGNSDDLRAAAIEATDQADELHKELRAVHLKAARAIALAELADDRASFEREMAEREAAFCAGITSARAALEEDRLREGAVAELEEEVCMLKQQLKVSRQTFSETLARCKQLEDALLQRQRSAHVRGESTHSVNIAAWRTSLCFCTARDLTVVATACSELRVAAQRDELWESLSYKMFAPAELLNCSNFRAAVLARKYADNLQQVSTSLSVVLPQLSELSRMVKEEMPRTVCWAPNISKVKKGTCLQSPYFDLHCLRNSYIEFYPKGDDEAEAGQCSLYLNVSKGMQVDVSIFLDDVHVNTLQHRVGKKAKCMLWGFTDLAPAPRSQEVSIVLSFNELHANLGRCPFDTHDICL